MGAIGVLAGAVSLGAGSALAYGGTQIGNKRSANSNSIIGNTGNSNTSSTNIVGEQSQQASSENVGLSQNELQREVQLNNQKPGVYVDNPRRALGKLLNNNSNNNNLNATNNNNNQMINR